MRRLGDEAESSMSGASKATKALVSEIGRLKKQAAMDRAKASSEDYVKAQREAKSAAEALSKALRGQTGEVKKLASAQKSSISATRVAAGTLAGLTLAAGASTLALGKMTGEMRELSREAWDFAKSGASAADTAKAFERLGDTAADVDRFRKATANAVDETSLQRLRMLSDDLTLTKGEFENVAKAATALTARFPETGTVAENLERILAGETEALRKLGVVIDKSGPKFKGLSEEGQKLATTLEVAAYGATVGADAFESQSLAMAATEAKASDLVSEIKTFFSEIITGSGFLDELSIIMDDLRALFLENKDSLRSLIKSGLDGFIKALQTAINLARKLASALDTVDTLLNGPGFANGAKALDKSAGAALLKGVDKNSQGAKALQPLFAAAREGNLKQKIWNGELDIGEALAVVNSSTDEADKPLRNALKQMNTRLQGDTANYVVSGGLSKDLLRLEAAINLSAEETRKNAEVTAKAATEATKPKPVDEVAPEVDAGADSDPKRRKRRSLLARPERPEREKKTRRAGTEDLIGALSSGAGTGAASGAEGALNAYTIYDRLKHQLDMVRGSFEELAQEMERTARVQEEVANALADGFTGAFDTIINGSGSFRDRMMGVLGELWGMLSTAFMAWATAEGSLLAGNPFGAMAAAIALGAVASAISAIGNRGSGGGGGSSRQTGSSIQSALERQRARDEESQSTDVRVYIDGLLTPDATARAILEGAERGLRLQGRRMAA